MIIVVGILVFIVYGAMFFAQRTLDISVDFAITSESQSQEVRINGVRVGSTPLRLKLADVPGRVVTLSSSAVWPPLDGWVETDSHRKGDELQFAELARFRHPSDERNVRFFLRVRDHERTTVAPLEILMGFPGREWFASNFGMSTDEGWLGTSYQLGMGMMDPLR